MLIIKTDSYKEWCTSVYIQLFFFGLNYTDDIKKKRARKSEEREIKMKKETKKGTLFFFGKEGTFQRSDVFLKKRKKEKKKN